MADSPFPKRLSEQQLDLLRAIYAGLHDSEQWPTFAYVDKVLDRQGLDINEVAASLPRGLTNVSVRPLNPSDEATLTLAGLSYLPEAHRDLALLLEVLKRAIEAEKNFNPQPGRSDGPEITSDDLAPQLELSPRDIKRLRVITQFEPWIGGSGFTQEGRWNFLVTREVRRYRSVKTIEEYVALRQQAYQNAFGAGPPRTYVIQGDARSAPRADRSAVEISVQNTRQIFVIMPFKQKFDGVYESIKSVCAEVGVACKRSDEIVEVGRITEQIYEALRDADVIIADITGPNANVMYELGYAHALKKAVILLNSGTRPPFDVADYRHIRYRTGNFDEVRVSLAMFLRSALRLTN